MKTTADSLKEIIELRDLKQVDILKLATPYCKQYNIKLNKSDLSQFVSGKVIPGQWKLTILGMALNVSEAWLMGYEVPMERQEKPAPGLEGEFDAALIDRLRMLTPEEMDRVDAFVQGILASRTE